MFEYGDNDRSTPDSLLKETISYARQIFDDLKKAKIISGNKWNSKIQSIGVTCVADDADISWLEKHIKNLIVRRKDGEYSASHPAIIDSVYHHLIKKVMEKAGFSYTNSINTGKRFDQYQENDFDWGGTRGSTSIESIGISCQTSPEKLRQTLTIDNLVRTREFDYLCLKSLQESFEEMAKFRKQSEPSKAPTVITVVLLKPTKPGG